LTIVVSMKRHITRFFPENLNPRDRPAEQNVPPGTVVDKVMVHPVLWEFYIASHTAIQGTSKVPKYVVLTDENGFTSDELQRVTYTLAYGHQIVTQSVSLPAPVYGAHELAKRGKSLFYAYQAKDDVTSNSSGNLDMGSLIEELNEKLQIKNTVFATRKHWA
jgi:eukaryotic translation initiation factor 2C